MAYTMLGKYFIIHGGIDFKNKFVNELFHFDMGIKKFKKLIQMLYISII
jgi:hypothetical protein